MSLSSELTDTSAYRRPFLYVAGVVAFGLGLWGWHEQASIFSSPHAFANAVFRTMQLITLQFPQEFDEKAPWQLQIARLVVPIIAVLLSYNAVIARFRQPAELARLRRRRGHVLVVGDGEQAQLLARAFRAHKRTVAIVAPGVDDAARAALAGIGAVVSAADLRQPKAATELGLKGAQAAVIATGEDARNLNLALAMLSLVEEAGRDEPLEILVHLEEAPLGELAGRVFDGLGGGSQAHLRPFSMVELSLQHRLSALLPPLAVSRRPLNVLMLGCGANGATALRVALPLIQTAAGARPRLTILAQEFDLDPYHAFANLRPELGLLVEINLETPAVLDLEALLSAAERLPPPDLVIVTAENDQTALTSALWLRDGRVTDRWNSPPILVRQALDDRFLGALGSSDIRGFDASRIIAYGADAAAEVVARALNVNEEKIAQATHEHYLALMGAGQASTPATQPWEILAENYREANRAPAAHLDIKLAAIDCLRTAQKDGWRATELTEDETLQLAELEHQRWCGQRIAVGWRYGATRDDRLRLHPDLVAWADLPGSARLKDVNAIKALPDLLSKAKQIIVRRLVTPIRIAEGGLSAKEVAEALTTLESARPDEAVVAALELPDANALIPMAALLEHWKGPVELISSLPPQRFLEDAVEANRAAARALLSRAQGWSSFVQIETADALFLTHVGE